MAFQNNNPNSLKIINNENTKQENKQSKTIIGTNDLNSSSKTNSLYNVDINNLGSKNLTSKQIEAAKALSSGQSLIFKYPKINYEVGERLDLSSIEILIKNFNNEIRLLKYDDISKNEKIDINLKHGDIIYENYYNSLFNEKFLEKETNHTKKSIIQYLEKNKINPCTHSIAIKIPNFSPINIKLNIKDSNLNLSPLELFRALKMKNSSMILLEADKLTYKVDEEINLEKFKFLVKKETGFLNIINGKDIKSESINVDLTKIDKDKKNFAKDKNSPYLYTYITLSKKGFKNLYIPITLIRNDIEKNQINNKNFDILSWGLNLDKSNSIYTLTLDVKNLSDVKEAKFKFLNSITKTAQNIKIDRIVKTNGFEEEDITLTNPLYRDEDNIEDYKDFSSKKMKEKLEKLEVKNPVKLSNSLETGYKYVFFIKKEADNKDNLLLDLETKTNDENPLKKEVEIEAKSPKIANILNKFIVLKDSENTPKAEEKAKVYGKFTIKKTDEKDNPLKDAEFRLSRRTENVKKEDLSPENFDPVTKRSGEDGKLEFDKLEPGIYTLEEVKAPYGYQELKYKYVVIVQKTGKTYVVDEEKYNENSSKYSVNANINSPIIDIDEKRLPMNLDGEIIVSGYSLDKKKAPFDLVDPSKGEALIMKANLELPDTIVEGDTFTLKLDKKLNMRGVSLVDKIQKEFKIGNAIVAKHTDTKFVDGQYIFIYTLTKEAEEKSNVVLQMERPLFIDSNEVPTSKENMSFVNIIAGKEMTPVIKSVRYDNYKSDFYDNLYSKLTIGATIRTNTKDNKIEYYSYLNTGNIDNPKFRLQNFYNDAQYKLANGNIDISNAEIYIYSVEGQVTPENISLPPSFGIKKMNLRNLIKTINSNSINIKNTEYGEYFDIDLSYLGNKKSYIIIVKGLKYKNNDSDKSIMLSGQIGYKGLYNYYPYHFNKGIVKAIGKSEGKGNLLSEIKIIKTNSDGTLKLRGAIFKLSNSDGYTKTRTSSSNGELVFIGLKSGKYTLEEVTPPEGYKKSENKWSIDVKVEHGMVKSINSSNSEIYINNNTITIKNEEDPDIIPPEINIINYLGKLGKFDVLKKSNTLNGDIFLKSAEFTLFRDDKATKPLKIIKDLQGKITVIGDSTQGTQDYKVTSDDKGIASFVNLPSGTYYLKETRAPKGYFLNPNAIWTVIVGNDGKVQISELNNIDKNLYKIVNDVDNIAKIEIVNKIVVYPATGGIGTRIFTFIGLSLMSIAYIELKRNKKYIKKGE